jgi:hypothetical protein
MANEADHPANQQSVRLYQHEGATFSTTDARIRPDGALQLSGYDLGEAAQQFVGHDDYEYDVTLKPGHKDVLLLALLADRFGGDSCASSHFRHYLKAKGIPYDFDTWP